MPAFEAVERPKPVAVLVGEKILAAIQEGTFPVGSRLPTETQLASQFGVSRPSIREALAALQFAGHIESRRGAGSVVVRVESSERPTSRALLRTPDDAVDWIEARCVIEPQLIAIAATDPDPASLADAQELIGGMRLSVDEHAFHPTTDLRVHRTLAGLCRNRLLAADLDRLLNLALEPVLAPARQRAWDSDELPSLWAEQHRAILDAVTRGSASEARQIAQAHLASTAQNIGEALDLTESARSRLDSLLATGARMSDLPG
jgi:DNA-binding FadR family transcriptional regulator